MSIIDVISDHSDKNLDRIPDGVLSMCNLKMLYLENNSITQLPQDFFDRLQCLTWLDLRRNKLKTIPSGIAHHPLLETLLLQRNEIEVLPNEIGLVPNLKVLQLTGNPLVYPKLEVIEKGLQTICSFLKEQYYNTQLGSCSSTDNEDEIEDIKLSVSEKPSADESTPKKSKTRLDLYKNLFSSQSSTALNVKSVKRPSGYKERTRKIGSRPSTPNQSKSSHLSQNDSNPKTSHDITRKPNKIKIRSQLYYTKKQKNPMDEAVNKELSDLWLKRLKELLAEQENILQQEKNLSTLSKWRKTKKMEVRRIPQDVEIEAPFDTDPEYNKLMSREDMTDQVEEIIKKTKKSRVAKNPSTYSPDQIQTMIDEVVNKMKEMEVKMQHCEASPREEQENSRKHIKNIVDLHKAILTLQRTNDNT